MKVEDEFPIQAFVVVKELYLDEYILRDEGVDPQDKMEPLLRANTERLLGHVGVVVGHDRCHGMQSHDVVNVEFSDGNQYYFAPCELELSTSTSLSIAPPLFKEVTNYTALTDQEKELAEKLFLAALAKADDYHALHSKLYYESLTEELSGTCIMAAKLFHRQISLRWSNGTKLVQGKE